MNQFLKLSFSLVCMSLVSHVVAMDEKFLSLSQKHAMTAVGLLRKDVVTPQSVAGRLSPNLRRTVDALSPMMEENLVPVMKEKSLSVEAERVSPVDRVINSELGQQLFIAIQNNVSRQELISLFKEATKGCPSPIIGAVKFRADTAYCKIFIIGGNRVDFEDKLNDVRCNSPFSRYPNA